MLEIGNLNNDRLYYALNLVSERLPVLSKIVKVIY